MEIGRGRSPEHRGRAERPSWSVSREGGVCGSVETAWGDDGEKTSDRLGGLLPPGLSPYFLFLKKKKFIYLATPSLSCSMPNLGSFSCCTWDP